MKTPLKASELIKILQKRIDESGDHEVSINTQDGGSYNIYSEDGVRVLEYTMLNGETIKAIEIG